MLTGNKILRYTLIALSMLLLLGLIWWYFFLHSRIQTITTGNAGRGTGVNTPGNSVGTTYNNIVSGIATRVSNTGASIGNKSGATPRLSHVTKTPVAGMGFYVSGQSETLRFVERATGNILEADLDTNSVTRLTNKLTPKIYEALFYRGTAILRSLNENGNVTSFLGTIATSSPVPFPNVAQQRPASNRPDELIGKYLDNNILGLAPNPKTGELFYLVQNAQEGTSGVRLPISGKNPKLVFSSLLSDWKPTFLSDDRIFLAQKAADDTPGYAYELKNDGTLSSVLRDISGLTFLPHDSSPAILFGESSGGALTLSVRIREDASIVQLSLKTIADKCVWAPPAISETAGAKAAKKLVDPLVLYCAVPQSISSKNFLNDWYRGILHTSDSWWRVDASTDTVKLVYMPSDADGAIDVENPIIDDKGENIAFMNARDDSLWLLRANTAASSAATTTPS